MNVFQTECASESLGDIVKVEVARVGLGWSLRFCISSNKFPGNAHSTVCGPQSRTILNNN